MEIVPSDEESSESVPEDVPSEELQKEEENFDWETYRK